MVVAGGWDRGMAGLLLDGYGLFCQMKTALWMDGGDGSTTTGMNLMPLNHILKKKWFKW